MEMLHEQVHLNYGEFGLKAIQPERIIGKQIEAARVALTRHMKRTGKFGLEYFLIFQYPKNQQKLEWVKEKDHLNTGLAELNQVEFYLKLMVSQKMLLEKLFIKLLLNFLLKQNL